MSTEDEYSNMDDETCEELDADVVESTQSSSSINSPNCESFPRKPELEESTALLQLPVPPVHARQSARIKLYGRAPNPSMTLNGVEYVLQRRRRPRYRANLLYEDTFVVVRMQRSSGSKEYINVIARVPTTLSIPVLNESFDIDTYLSSTRVALEVFDVKQHSSDNTVLGRTLLYPRSEKTTFYLSDIIGFAEVFRPKGAEIVVHGIIPGAQACLELACTETCPSRIVPAKMWRRAKLSVIKSTIGLSIFPFAPLFLLNSELIEKACSDKLENIENVRQWMNTSRTTLLSLAPLSPLPTTAIGISQRMLSASLLGADAVCQLLDDLWEYYNRAPATLVDLSIDIFSALLHAFIHRATPVSDVLKQIRTIADWYATFSYKLKAIESTKYLTKWIGKLFIKKIFVCPADSQTIVTPTWSRACALEPSISEELIDAIYQFELELFKNQSVSSEPDYTPQPINHMQGVANLLNPVLKIWLNSFDDAVRAGNYNYVLFMVSQGKTKDSNLFAPLGLISLSKTLLFSTLDFDVTQKMILQSPSALSRYISTAPIDWVMLSGNGDMLNGFLSVCLENGESSIDLVQKTYEIALSGSVRTLRDIPQQLMPTLTLPHAIALIMGSMVFGDAGRLLGLFGSLRTCVFESTTTTPCSFPLFDITKTFINRSLVLEDSSSSTFSIPESLRAAIEQLFSPPIYLLFSTSDQVGLLSAIVESQLDQAFIVELLTILSSRASILHCSDSECLLQHALNSGKLEVAACLLYDMFIDPTKHLASWLSTLGCYSDGVIMHFMESLFLRTTAAECDAAINACYESMYSTLIKQKRFDSLRVVNSHIKDLMSSEAFVNYKQVKFGEEDIIRLYLFATMAPSGKILISERTVDDILTLIEIFGPRSLTSVDVLFRLGSFGLDELLEELLGSGSDLSPDQLVSLFTDILNRISSILPNLLSIFLKFLEYVFTPLTDDEVKNKVKRPSLDFLIQPNNLVLSLLSIEDGIALLYKHLEMQFQSSGLSWGNLGDALNSEVKDQKTSNGLTCLAIVQSVLTHILSEYNARLSQAREFAKLACTQMVNHNLSAMVAYLEFILIQRAVTATFIDSSTILTLEFMSVPTISFSAQSACPFSMTILTNLNLCVCECDQLMRMGAYPVHSISREILQRILQIKGICTLCHSPPKSNGIVSEDTDIMYIPTIQSYYRFLNALHSDESSSHAPLPILPMQSVSEQITSLTDAYLTSRTDKELKEKDDSSPVMFSAQFVDRDLLSAPKRKPTFRGDTILHTIFSLFDFTVLDDISESLATTLSEALTSIFAEHSCSLFNQLNASYKMPLQMISISSLDHALLVLNAIKKVDQTLLSSYTDTLADYPSLIHYFLFRLITNTSEHILSQILPLVPKAIMRDFLLAPCYSFSNSILLTALLQRGVTDIDYLIGVYKQYGCLAEAAVMPNCGGWCAVTIALQNPNILEVPHELFEAAMKSPKEALVNKYGHTPLHCLFFNESLVSQTPHKDEDQYVYGYHVLSDTKIDPVFKLSIAQQLARVDSADAISQLDRFGMSPLHYAVMSSAFVCMESLLGKHSSVQLLDRAGLDRDVTPLELALARKSEQMVQLLLQKGANPLRRTSVTSFLGEPLTVFARLIQNGYLNLAYTVIYQHSSMKTLLLNEALHANTTNSKPVLRALIDGVSEACITYLALSISGRSMDNQLTKQIIDSLQCIYTGSGKKFHLTNWLSLFVFSPPNYWFSGDNSLYNLLVKIAIVSNFAENNLAFNLRMIGSNISVKLLYNGLRVRRLVSSLKADTDSENDSAFIEKASPVELMLLKLYSTLCQDIFAEKEFLTLLQLYICKSLHVSPLIPRIILDFLAATQTETLTRANVQFCSQFFKCLNSMLTTNECLIPGIAAKTLRMHTKEFIIKLIGTEKILNRLFAVLALPPAIKSASSGFARSIILGRSMNTDGCFMEDYTPCCVEILKCYVATNSVVWPLFFSTIYGLRSEMHKNPKQVITHVFDQLNSVDQVSKPTMETLFSAATASLTSLHSRGCPESVIASYLSDLLEAAKQEQLYGEMLAKILNDAQSIKSSTDNEISAPCSTLSGLDNKVLDQKFTEAVTYVKRLIDAPTDKTLQPNELKVPSIMLGCSQEPVQLVDQVFYSIPSQTGSVFYKEGSPLRVDGHYYHFMLVNALPRGNGLLLVFHSYSLQFNRYTDSYALSYKSKRSVAELRNGCYSWYGLSGYWPEKKLCEYKTVDQAIKSFYSYFKKKSGLSFMDCCTNGLSQAYYESTEARKGMVCYVGKNIAEITARFLEVTPMIRSMLPDLFLYGVISAIANRLDSAIVPKLPSSECKDWRAIKIISSTVSSALSISLTRDETHYHEELGFNYTILCLKQALSVYEKEILPILTSPGFSKMINLVEDCTDTSSASRELILKAVNMGVYMHELSGLPMHLLPLFIIHSRLSLHYLKMYLSNIKMALDGVHRGSLLLLACLHSFAEPPSNVSVKSAITLVDCVLGVKLQILDKQTSFLLQTLNDLPKRTVFCRIYGYSNDKVADLVHNTREFVTDLSKGRKQCPESWITKRSDAESNESKSKIDWSDPSLLWVWSESFTNGLAPLLSGSLRPSKYDQWGISSYGFNFDTTPPYGISVSPTLFHGTPLRFGVIVNNVSSFLYGPQSIGPDVMKIAPGVFWSLGRNELVQEYAGAGFKYHWSDQRITAVSFTPEDMHLQYVAFL